MLYHYSAVDDNGKVLEGTREADKLEGVFQFLSSQGLKPISIRKLKEGALGVRRFFGGIRITDKIFLTKYLSLMLKVGTDLLSAIDILIADFDKMSVRNLLLEIRENLVQGKPFYEVFARYEDIFSPVFVNLVKAAEASGNLQQTFDSLSTSLTHEAELRSRIRAAITYPVILLIVSFVIFLFIVTFAIPRVANIFLQSNIEPPLFSKVVFTIGIFVGSNVVYILIAMLVGGGGTFYFFWKTELGRRLRDKMLHRLPLIRNVYHEIAIQRFAGTFSSLLKAGLPIVEAIRITADTVGSHEIRAALLRISNEGLSKGITIGKAFGREPILPRLVTSLVSISEKAGHLEDSLETLASFYATNIDSSVKSLMAFLEPILLLVMGVLIGFVALSMIVPVYQLTSQI